MAFQVSPGINVSELDLSTTIANVSVSDAAFAAAFQWGPANVIQNISSERLLVDTYGKPTTATETNWLTAASFLAYAGSLQVVRTIDASAATNATDETEGTEGYLIESETHYDSLADAGSSFLADATFIARYPGVYGNGLQVGITHVHANDSGVSWAAAASTANGNTVNWSGLFDDEPNADGGTDKIHVVVLTNDTTITGTKGEVLEKHAFVSIASDGKDDQGNSNYLPEVLRRDSKYIYATGNFDGNADLADIDNWDTSTIAGGETFDTLNSTAGDATKGSYLAIMRNGASNNTNGNNTANRKIGYDKFSDAEATDVSLIFTGADNGGGLSLEIESTVVGIRKDCVLFVSPDKGNVVSNASLSDKSSAVVTAKAQKPSSSRSYIVMDSGWKRMYNKYTDKFIAVPLNGDIAGLCVATDNSADTWFSPAGFNRGGIKNAASLYFDPDKTSRDTLYKAGINPVSSFPGEGIVLFGDKTLQTTPSAFDRINVRRLFIVLEKTISRAARSMLFEFNDEFTRAQFRSMVEPFLRNIKARRGVTDYQVVCDTTNNTADVIDRNEFVGDIFVKPARSINFIQLNFVAVSTGVSFEEVVGAV